MEYNIAFSSSGARFAAHLGVLAYLQDNNIKIKNYSGSSGGAIVATWGANGLPARELLELTLKFGYARYFVKPLLTLGGFLDHSAFGKTIAAYCKPKRNLWIVTFNLLKMRKEIWIGENINLSQVLIATTSIPGLFKPIIYSDGIHVDGLFASFCPDDLWHEGKTISVQLKSKSKTSSRYLCDNFVHEIERATIEFLERLQKKNLKRDHVIYIQPEVGSIAQTDIFTLMPDDHLKLFEEGYKATERTFNDMVACLHSGQSLQFFKYK